MSRGKKQTFEVTVRTHDYNGNTHEYTALCATNEEASAKLDALQAQAESRGETIEMQGIWINQAGEEGK